MNAVIVELFQMTTGRSHTVVVVVNQLPLEEAYEYAKKVALDQFEPPSYWSVKDCYVADQFMMAVNVEASV